MSVNLKDFTTEDLIKELELRGYKANKIKTKTATEKKELLNPVIYYREYGEIAIREKLEQIELPELVKIAKTYTPDLNGTIYRTKKPEKIIDFIIDRAVKSSKYGQCFRTCSDDTKTSY